MAIEPQAELSEMPEMTGETVPVREGLAPWMKLLGFAAILVTATIYFCVLTKLLAG